MEWHNQLTNVISTMWDIYHFRLCTMQPLNYGKRFPYFILHATLLSHTHLYWFSFKFIIAAFVAPLTNVHSLSLEEVNSPRYERIRRIFSIPKLCNNNRIYIEIIYRNSAFEFYMQNNPRNTFLPFATLMKTTMHLKDYNNKKDKRVQPSMIAFSH